MTKCAHLSGISRNFFSPIQQPYEDPQPNQQKNLYDHLSNHLLTTSGCRDFYRVFGYTLTFLKYLPFSSKRKEFFDKFGSLAGKFNVALSIPKTVADVNFLKQSLRHLHQVRNHPPVHPERRKIITQAYKSCILDGMNVTNSIVEDLMFLHDIDLIKLGKSYPAAEGIYYITCLVPDTIELVTKVYELRHYKGAAPTTDVERTVLKDKIKLAWLTIAKDLPAIICAVIGIAAIFFASLQVPAVAAVSMGLSILWLTFKLVSTFYEKTIVEKHARLSRA